MDRKVYRVIDANIDRAKEGLRVVEDTLRFVFERKELLEKLRELRQKISSIPSLLKISPTRLLASRESEKDLGREREEKERKDIPEILSSNFSRLEESIRVLEEYSRMLNREATSRIKKLRFKVYDIQKRAQLLIHRKNIIEKLGLYVITDEEITGKPHHVIASEAVKGGVDVIQLRDKKSSTNRLLEEARKMRNVIPEKVLFIINDRADIALSSGADGVHLGKDDLPIQEARKLIGEDKIIGFSCNNVEEAIDAEEAGADYISLGPIFHTTTKKDLPPPLGIGEIKKAKSRISIPLVVIGGIDENNMEDVLRAGADSVAMISAILKYGDILKRVKTLKEKFLAIKEKIHKNR